MNGNNITDKPISNRREVGSDFFALAYIKTSKYNLQHYLEKFDTNDYWIYKATGKQKQVSIEDFLEFKYSIYIFFKKGVYDSNNINIWIDWFNNNSYVNFLDRRIPPFNPEKIIIRK